MYWWLNRDDGAGALLRHLPPDTYASVLTRLPDTTRRRALTSAGSSLAALIELELRRGDRAGLADLAANQRLTSAGRRRLAALRIPEVDDALLFRDLVDADVCRILLARSPHSPDRIVDRFRGRDTVRMRPLLGAEDLDVVAAALARTPQPAPLDDPLFVSAALRLWRVRGADAVYAALQRTDRRVTANHLRLLRPYLEAPDGRALLEQRALDHSGPDGQVRRLRLGSKRNCPQDVLGGETDLDWDLLLRAHREKPFGDRARLALLGHSDCPPEAPPELLRGLTRWDQRIVAALYAGVTTAAEVVRHAAPAWGMLGFIERLSHPIDRAPWAGSSSPFLYALLDLDPAGLLGDDVDAWLRLLRIGPRFAGTIAEMIDLARQPGHVPELVPRTRTQARPKGNPGALLLLLAPPSTALEVVEHLGYGEFVEAVEGRRVPLHPELAAVAERRRVPQRPPSWREPPVEQLELPTRERCLAKLREHPLDLDESPRSRPGARWVWPALGLRLIDGRDLVEIGHPAAAVLTLVDRSRVTVPEAHATATEAIRNLVTGPMSAPDAADAWTVALTLLDGFAGTVPELLTTARASTSRCPTA